MEVDYDDFCILYSKRINSMSGQIFEEERVINAVFSNDENVGTWLVVRRCCVTAHLSLIHI